MARFYLDSSALVKRYHAEQGTADVDVLFQTSGNRLFISRLALVEVQSTLARLVREGSLDSPAFIALASRLEADVAAGNLTVLALSHRRLEEAQVLLGTLGLQHNMRSLDVLHLATALALQKRSKLAGFVAADKKLLTVAANGCGLTTVAVG